MRNYEADVTAAGTGGTPRLCHEALVDMLKELLAEKKYNGQEKRKRIKVYRQDLPITTENDEDADTDSAPAPYVVVQMTGGKIPEGDGPQHVDFVIVVCAYDDEIERNGYTEVSNILEDIMQRVLSVPWFGGVFTILRAMDWSIQKDDTAPYYFGALVLTCTAPAMTTDTTLADLI